MAVMAKVRFTVKVTPSKERDINCNCPGICVGCGTETGLRSYDSQVYKKKPPMTLSGGMQITRANGNYRLCGDCKEQAVSNYTKTIKTRRNIRIILLLLGVALIPISFIVMMFLFPNFLFMPAIGYTYLLVYWGVMMALILFVFGLAGSINRSREEMQERVERYPFKAYVDVTIDGTMLLSNETYAEKFRGLNPSLLVKIKPGLKTPGITPDAAIFYMMFVILFIFILIGTMFMFF